MYSHASNPVVDEVDDNIIRIYFSTRDTLNRSSVAWLEIDPSSPKQLHRIAEIPILSPGNIGCFDDSGCSIGSIVREGRKRFLYYMGWNLGVTVPWRNSIGLALSENEGKTYERVSIAPIVDRSGVDPYTLSYPWVLRNGNDWEMWYGSNLQWGKTQADMFHVIKHAYSSDGYAWRRDGKIVIQPSLGEYAFARPSLLRDPDRYRMWYAYRGDYYRIGYAESIDGVVWHRKDAEVGIAPSPGEWDGESIEYPCVFDHGADRFLLYCGNGYGKTGFGIAVLDKE